MIRNTSFISAILASSICFAQDASDEQEDFTVTPAETMELVMEASSSVVASEPEMAAPEVVELVEMTPAPMLMSGAELAVAMPAPVQYAELTFEKPAVPETTKLVAEEAPPTALYLISSSDGYYTNAYVEGKNGFFSIGKNFHNGVTINFNMKGEYWALNFTAPGKGRLESGIYKNAECFPFNTVDRPGFAIHGYQRGCDELKGEFEILEIKYNDKEQVETFAANFIQKCSLNGLPLFGSVRYHSSAPVEARFSDILKHQTGTVLYLTKSNRATGVKSQPVLITEEESTFKFNPLPYGGEGIQVVINDKEQGQWKMDFAVPHDGKFVAGSYENAGRYPFQSPTAAGIEIETPDGYFTRPQASFKVLNVSKNSSGEVEALALNFVVHNENGETLEGAVRFNSKVAVDLEKPYKE